MNPVVRIALLAAGWAALSRADPAPAEAPTPAASNTTVVTSTRLTYDQLQRRAVFEEHVEVVDGDLTIRTDRLTVLFTEDNKVDRLEADGHVVIVRDDVRATGDRASYAVQDGKLQLMGEPRVQRNQDTLTGETITLWRQSRRILCEPNARLVLSSDQAFDGDFKK